jgi:hypothetical protein
MARASLQVEPEADTPARANKCAASTLEAKGAAVEEACGEEKPSKKLKIDKVDTSKIQKLTSYFKAKPLPVVSEDADVPLSQQPLCD